VNVIDAADDMRTALATITGLRVPAFGERGAGFPMALIALPQVTYDATYRRGKDRVPDWPLYVVVGAPNTRPAVRKAAAYMSGSGSQSVKAAIEAGTYTACDRPRVTNVEVDLGATFNGKPALCLTFHLDVIGPGA
jgi:hypothetical protein